MNGYYFIVIYKTRKGVPTDLAQRLLGNLFDDEIQSKFPTGDEYLISKIALKVIDALKSDSKSIWYEKIRDPNAEKNYTTVSQNIFAQSLIPLLKNGLMKDIGKYLGKENLIKTTAAIASRYWNVLSKN